MAPLQLSIFNHGVLGLGLRSQLDDLSADPPSKSDDWHFRVSNLVHVHMGKQRDHGDEAGNGKDIHRSRGFFANVDLLMGDVVAYCKCLLFPIRSPIL